MKIRFTITVAACAASILALTSVNAANEIWQTTHGSACQATSLGQATNFNASWSAKGVRNINSVESSKSFFVVCPMDLTQIENLTSTTPDASSVSVALISYQDLTTQVAQCTFKRYDFQGNLIKSVVGTPASATPSSDTSQNFNVAFGLINPADRAISFGTDVATVVCALNPQTTIVGTVSRGGNNPVSAGDAPALP